MNRNYFNCLFFLSVAFLFVACSGNKANPQQERINPGVSAFALAGEIPVPDGFNRIREETGSFGAWLRQIPLKKSNTVYLYNGRLKENQSAQYAVLDISRGEKDLQQCADAVMRLRAEYLFRAKRHDEIVFADNNKKEYRWAGGNNRPGFERYLETIFGWCGSASLEKQLKPVESSHDIRPGDVFIHGGFPGHAMLVMDVAVNQEGKKIFMLSQSYMPAQDIHIVRNPRDEKLSPWFSVREGFPVITPEWKFMPGELRTW